MSKIQTLEKLKNQIINKLVNVRSLEEIKNKEMLKGGFFKQFFKYIFFKPTYFNKRDSSLDKFFIDENGFNYLKRMISSSSVFMIGVGGVMSALAIKSITPMLIFLIGLLGFVAVTMLIFGICWVLENKETKKKFDAKNIEDIKKNLLEKYNDFQVRSLLKERLDKKELVNIMKELEKTIGKDEIMRCFEEIRKANNYEKTFNDISKPYVLVELIKILISKEKEENNKKEEKEINNFNNGIIDSLINDGTESNKDEIESFNIKEHLQSIKNSKEREKQQLVREI